jgi:hypothetical protein
MSGKALMACVVLLGTAGAFLPLGILLAARSFRLWWYGMRTRAKVVAYDGDSEGAVPVIVFQDHTNRAQRVRLWFGNGLAVGGSMEIVYLRENPARVRGNSFEGLWAVPIILIALGTLSLFFGVAVLAGAPVE